MITPILITPLDDNKLEVLTDFKTVLQSAKTLDGQPLSVLREPKDSPGLIGAIWTLE